MAYRVFISQHTAGLDAMKKGDQKFPRRVLKVLHECGTFSVFEATANDTIARVMTNLQAHGYIEVTPRGFPWSDVKVTPKGREYAGLK